MRNSIFHSGKESYPAGAEWEPTRLTGSKSHLGTHYAYLNDPDPQRQMVKIKKELHRTHHKIKRKRSDRSLLWIFLLLTSGLITALIFRQKELYSLVSVITIGTYLFTGILLILKVLIPIGMDIRYLRVKIRFLHKMKKETLTGHRPETL